MATWPAGGGSVRNSEAMMSTSVAGTCGTVVSVWGRFFDIYEPLHALVAEEGKTLLGLAHYLFHRSTIIVEASCYLHDLFTAEAARGKGVGRALIEASMRAVVCSCISQRSAQVLASKSHRLPMAAQW